MTTLLQLPLALTTSAADLLLLEQQQSTNAVTLNTLLEGTQPLITIASETLLGRVSIAPGLPEPIGIGAGLVLQSGSLAVDATVVVSADSPALTGSPTAPTPPVGDSSNAIATTAFVRQILPSLNLPSIDIVGDAVGSGTGTIALSLPAITTPGTFARWWSTRKGRLPAAVRSCRTT
jgi:hypothetical protein